MRSNQIPGITSDFKMDIINTFIRGTLCLHQASYIHGTLCLHRASSNPALEGVFHWLIETKAKLRTTASMKNVTCYKLKEFAHGTRHMHKHATCISRC